MLYRRYLLILNALLICLAAMGPASAEYIPPQLVKVSTASFGNQHLIYNPGRYIYAVSWQGIPVASAEVIIGESPQLKRNDYVSKPDDLTIRVTAKSAKVIDLLYKLRHTSESVFSSATLKPRIFTLDQTENSKYKRIEVSYSPEHLISTKLWKEPGEREPNESSTFDSDNLTLDPLFGAILARSLPFDRSTQTDFDVWNGKNRFLITFKVEGQDYIEIGKNKVLADRIIPTVKKLTDSEGEKRLKSCAMWISADERREILKLESKVFIGRVSAILKSIEPLPHSSPAAPILRAANEKSSTETDAVSGRAMLETPK